MSASTLISEVILTMQARMSVRRLDHSQIHRSIPYLEASQKQNPIFRGRWNPRGECELFIFFFFSLIFISAIVLFQLFFALLCDLSLPAREQQQNTSRQYSMNGSRIASSLQAAPCCDCPKSLRSTNRSSVWSTSIQMVAVPCSHLCVRGIS